MKPLPKTHKHWQKAIALGSGLIEGLGGMGPVDVWSLGLRL